MTSQATRVIASSKMRTQDANAAQSGAEVSSSSKPTTAKLTNFRIPRAAGAVAQQTVLTTGGSTHSPLQTHLNLKSASTAECKWNSPRPQRETTAKRKAETPQTRVAGGEDAGGTVAKASSSTTGAASIYAEILSKPLGLTKDVVAKHTAKAEVHTFTGRGLMEALLEHKMRTGRVDAYPKLASAISFERLRRFSPVPLADADDGRRPIGDADEDEQQAAKRLKRGPMTPPGSPRGPRTPPPPAERWGVAGAPTSTSRGPRTPPPVATATRPAHVGSGWSSSNSSSRDRSPRSASRVDGGAEAANQGQATTGQPTAGGASVLSTLSLVLDGVARASGIEAARLRQMINVEMLESLQNVEPNSLLLMLTTLLSTLAAGVAASSKSGAALAAAAAQAAEQDCQQVTSTSVLPGEERPLAAERTAVDMDIAASDASSANAQRTGASNSAASSRADDEDAAPFAGAGGESTLAERFPYSADREDRRDAAARAAMHQREPPPSDVPGWPVDVRPPSQPPPPLPPAPPTPVSAAATGSGVSFDLSRPPPLCVPQQQQGFVGQAPPQGQFSLPPPPLFQQQEPVLLPPPPPFPTTLAPPAPNLQLMLPPNIVSAVHALANNAEFQSSARQPQLSAEVLVLQALAAKMQSPQQQPPPLFCGQQPQFDSMPPGMLLQPSGQQQMQQHAQQMPNMCVPPPGAMPTSGAGPSWDMRGVGPPLQPPSMQPCTAGELLPPFPRLAEPLFDCPQLQHQQQMQGGGRPPLQQQPPMMHQQLSNGPPGMFERLPPPFPQLYDGPPQQQPFGGGGFGPMAPGPMDGPPSMGPPPCAVAPRDWLDTVSQPLMRSAPQRGGGRFATRQGNSRGGDFAQRGRGGRRNDDGSARRSFGADRR